MLPTELIARSEPYGQGPTRQILLVTCVNRGA
jgi:hypothetical protein